VNHTIALPAFDPVDVGDERRNTRRETKSMATKQGITRWVTAAAAVVALAGWIFAGPAMQAAQQRGGGANGGGGGGRNSPPLPALPLTLDTTLYKIRLNLVAKGLVNPWGLAFLPDGSMLVTERAGRLRIIRDGVLDPTPIANVPAVKALVLGGLLDVVLHPKFAENHTLYLSYSKPREDGLATTALARARLEGNSLADVKDIFVANSWSKSSTNYGGRIAFDRDGLLYLTIGERQEEERAQNPADHGGKVIRLRDDGTVPPDNPFVGKAGYAPEIYTIGHRSPQGLAMQPSTGLLWESEHGQQGGDELNILRPGKNYGWPLATFGINYDGEKHGEPFPQGEFEPPFAYWVPSIAISGVMFYTGDKFPDWKNNVFVGGMLQGRTRATGQMQRVVLNAKGQPIQREPLLVDLHQRIRDIHQGPDGFIYVLTDEPSGVVMKLEPVK
jgi:glucose/arabinose dehydrogenase